MRVIEDFVQERRATVGPPGYAAPAADAPFSLEEERRRLKRLQLQPWLSGRKLVWAARLLGGAGNRGGRR